jgi:hypothetical protein
LPHPAIQANIRGPKSRAGLIAYPAFAPNETPIAITIKPTTHGHMFALTGRLNSSSTANTNRTKKNVPTIWSINGPRTLWKYGAGKVANVLYVTTDAGCPLTMWFIWSKWLIALL